MALHLYPGDLLLNAGISRGRKPPQDIMDANGLQDAAAWRVRTHVAKREQSDFEWLVTHRSSPSCTQRSARKPEKSLQTIPLLNLF